MIGITGIRKLAMEVTRTEVLVSTHRISIYQLPSAIPALIGIGTVPAGIGTAEYILIGITGI